MLKQAQHTLYMQRFFFIACSIFLYACTPTATKPSPQQNPEIAYEVRQERIGQIGQWSLHARMAIQTVNDSNTGNLRWSQSADVLTLDIQGPFGINVAKIRGQQGAYTLQDRQGRRWQAKNIDQLIYNRTGWALPVEHLQYWILADTQNKNNAKFISNADGTLASLTFEQWHIQYEKYALIDDVRLPVKIRITHPDITMKLSIRKWRLNED